MMKIKSHDTSGESVTGSSVYEEQQSPLAPKVMNSLTNKLMEKICSRANLNQAYKRVKANKGSAGCDGMTVDEMHGWLNTHKEKLIESLLNGTFKPQPVRKVEIPKPDGGVRQLGIPTVIDRLVQQSILQILDPMFEATFSDSSYGFRIGKSAHQAVKQAREYVLEGRIIIVDLDLEKFFDRVNHDILMSKLAHRISDKRLLRIIRRFLQAGIMDQGVCVNRDEGTPQGGPLSPLLANIILDDLDKELERRGHKFCRYADDCNVYVNSLVAGERVMSSVKNFLEKKLKLKVNEKKSAVDFVNERKFLGFRLTRDGKITLAPASIEKVKAKIYSHTRRTSGKNLEVIIKSLNLYLKGWINYFGLIETPSYLKDIDGWMRRRLRCLRLKQRKRSYPIAKWLIVLGVKPRDAWNLAKSSRGWWRLSAAPQLHLAMSNEWFNKLGLISLNSEYLKLKGI